MKNHASTTRRRSRTAQLAAVLAVAMIAAACGGGDETAAPAPSPAPTPSQAAPSDEVPDLGTIIMFLSVPQSDVFLPAEVGPPLGKFEACGVDIRILTGASGQGMLSIAAGESDIVLTAMNQALSNIVQGVPAKMVAGQKNPWSQVLVVSKELADGGAVDTAGLRAIDTGADKMSIGISRLGSAGHLSSLRVAEFLGWAEDTDYEIIPLGGVNEITAGLEAGIIDMFAWSGGVAYNMEDKGVGRVIEDVVADAVGPIVFEGFVASNKFIEERPDALVAYMDCYFDYVAELKADPDEVVRLLSEWNYSSLAIDRALPLLLRDWNDDGAVTEADLQGLMDAVVFTVTDVTEPTPASDWWVFWQDLRS